MCCKHQCRSLNDVAASRESSSYAPNRRRQQLVSAVNNHCCSPMQQPRSTSYRRALRAYFPASTGSVCSLDQKHHTWPGSYRFVRPAASSAQHLPPGSFQAGPSLSAPSLFAPRCRATGLPAAAAALVNPAVIQKVALPSSFPGLETMPTNTNFETPFRWRYGVCAVSRVRVAVGIELVHSSSWCADRMIGSVLFAA